MSKFAHWASLPAEPHEAVKYEEINVQERSVNVGLQKLKEVPLCPLDGDDAFRPLLRSNGAFAGSVGCFQCIGRVFFALSPMVL